MRFQEFLHGFMKFYVIFENMYLRRYKKILSHLLRNWERPIITKILMQPHIIFQNSF